MKRHVTRIIGRHNDGEKRRPRPRRCCVDFGEPWSNRPTPMRFTKLMVPPSLRRTSLATSRCPLLEEAQGFKVLLNLDDPKYI
jgi:hypothetical protein